MIMNRKQFLSTAFMALATLAAGFGLTSCEDLFGEWDKPAPTNINLTPDYSSSAPKTFSATVSLAAITNAPEDDNLAPQWVPTEQVALIYTVSGETKKALATIEPIVSTNQATITAELDGNVTDGTAITLMYPASSLNESNEFNDATLANQGGTLASLATSGAVWCKGEGTLSVSGSSASLASDVMVESQVAFCKLTVKIGDVLANAKTMTVKDSAGRVIGGTHTMDPATSEFWLAMKPLSESIIIFEAFVDETKAQWEEDQTYAKNTYYAKELNKLLSYPEYTAEPAAATENFKWDDANHTLFTAGTTSSTGCTVKYKLIKGTDTAPTSIDDFEAWSDAMVQKKDAGTYYLWYYIHGDMVNFSHTPMSYVSKVITKETAAVTAAPAAVSGLTYDGNPKDLVTTGTATNGTMKYYVSTTNSTPVTTADGWTTTVPTGTNAGDYYVWYYAKSNDADNINDSEVTAIEGGKVSIVKGASTVTTAPTLVTTDLTYNGSAQALAENGACTGGTLKYYASTENTAPAKTASGWTTDGTVTNAGEYYVWYYVDGGTNYAGTDVTAITGTKTVAKAVATARATQADWQIGDLIASDGKAYLYNTTNYELPTGITAVAMVAYLVSGEAGENNGVGANGSGSYTDTNGTFSKGLAIALNDFTTSGAEDAEYSATMPQATAIEKAASYVRTLPGGTSKWFLPNDLQYKHMFSACGGISYTANMPSGTNWYKVGTFRTKLIACGGTYMKSADYYWTSGSAGNNGLIFKFHNTYGVQKLTHHPDANYHARAAFAF